MESPVPNLGQGKEGRNGLAANRSAGPHTIVAGAPAHPAKALLGLFIASLVLTVGIGGVLNFIYPISPRQAHFFVRSLGVWGPLGIVLVVALLIAIVPIPTIPFDIAAGIGFGSFLGTVYILLGHLIGAAIAFELSRRFGRPILVRVLPKKALANIDAIAEQLGVRLLVLMRLLPLFDFKVVSYAAGLTDLPFRSYMFGTLAGIVLPIFGMVSVGANLTAHPIRAALIVGSFGLATGAGAAYFLFRRRPAAVHGAPGCEFNVPGSK
ncbi:MAG: TVP38/TMEM64 family protein [Dehalococcoidia bacterium]